MKKYLPYLNFILIVIIAICVYLLYQRKYLINDSFAKKYSKTKIVDKRIQGIAKIIDGDTVIINGNRIRLLHIDTPETKQTCLDKNNKKYFCGKMATRYLKKIANGKIVKCFYEKKDVYNRFLAECYLGDVFLNLKMVESGMAVIYNHKSAGKKFIDARQIAKENNLGIWQGSFELPKVYRKRVRR